MLGGAELCLRDIVLGRGNRRDRVVLFQDGPLGDLLRQDNVGVRIESLGRRGGEVRKSSGIGAKIAASVGVAQLARRVAKVARDIDVIYANTAKALIVATIAGRLARRPVIYHLHDILSADHFSRSNLRLLSMLAKHGAAHVIANSQATADAFIAVGGNCDRITVIYNGIDSVPFDLAIARAERERAAIRASIGLTDEPLLGLFGRFAPWKGQHVAIEALGRLPGVHLMLVGDALFGEDQYTASIRRQADEQAPGRVHFMGFRSDVADMMRSSDAVIHCSTAPEPFGRVIVEAMLAARPVVASGAGGAKEIIEDGVTGILCEPNSVESLVAKIRLLIDGNVSVPRLTQAARKNAIQRFDLAARVDDVNQVIDKVAARGHRRW